MENNVLTKETQDKLKYKGMQIIQKLSDCALASKLQWYFGDRPKKGYLFLAP